MDTPLKQAAKESPKVIANMVHLFSSLQTKWLGWFPSLFTCKA